MTNKGKLLIIEDDSDLVRALELYFSGAGYEIISAEDGREGLQKLYDERPSIVILDIALPKMDGWDVCRRIRELSDVPIVMLTARTQEDERVKGIIGTIGDMDQYRLPDAKGYVSMTRQLSGETDEDRQVIRDEVLGTSEADFRDFVEILDAVREKGLVKVLGSQNAIEETLKDRPGWLAVTKVL